jgi:hypothetical protein
MLLLLFIAVCKESGEFSSHALSDVGVLLPMNAGHSCWACGDTLSLVAACCCYSGRAPVKLMMCCCFVAHKLLHRERFCNCFSQQNRTNREFVRIGIIELKSVFKSPPLSPAAPPKQLRVQHGRTPQIRKCRNSCLQMGSFMIQFHLHLTNPSSECT